jgi:hypothetical protein
MRLLEKSGYQGNLEKTHSRIKQKFFCKFLALPTIKALLEHL